MTSEVCMLPCVLSVPMQCILGFVQTDCCKHGMPLLTSVAYLQAMKDPKVQVRHTTAWAIGEASVNLEAQGTCAR